MIAHGFALMGIHFNDTSHQKRHVVTQFLSYHNVHIIFFTHILWRDEIASMIYWFRPNFRHALDSFPPSQYNHVNIVHKCDNARKHDWNIHTLFSWCNFLWMSYCSHVYFKKSNNWFIVVSFETRWRLLPKIGTKIIEF